LRYLFPIPQDILLKKINAESMTCNLLPFSKGLRKRSAFIFFNSEYPQTKKLPDQTRELKIILKKINAESITCNLCPSAKD